MICAKCGHDNREGSRYCDQCRAVLWVVGNRVCSKCGTSRAADEERCPVCGTKRSRLERDVVDTIKFWDLDYEDRMKVDHSFAKSGGSWTMQQWADYLFDDLDCPYFSDCEGWYQTYCTQLYNQGAGSIRSDWYAQKPERGINAFTGLPWGQVGPRGGSSGGKTAVSASDIAAGGKACADGVMGIFWIIVAVVVLGTCVKCG